MQIYGGETISGYYSKIPNHIHSEVEMMSNLLVIDYDEYVDFLYEKYSLEPIEKDESRKVSLEELKEWRDTESYIGTPIRREITSLRVGYPIKIGSKTTEVFKMDWGIIPAHDWDLDTSSGYIYSKVMNSPQAIKNEVQLLDQVISNKKALIEEGNPILKQRIKEIVDRRRKKLSEEKDNFQKLINEIDIPLEVVKKDAVKPVSFGISHKIQNLMPPKPILKDEYILDREKVLTTIEIIDNVATNFEAAPDTYAQLEEEQLRNIILSSLNSVFGGKATGETFRKGGKTDILLNIENGCILVMECKWWDGDHTLQEAISQLFKYLTWRENYGVIIMLSKNKCFTNVLNTIANSIQSHTSYKGGFVKINESHFQSNHIFQEDQEKNIDVHTLTYNLYYD